MVAAVPTADPPAAKEDAPIAPTTEPLGDDEDELFEGWDTSSNTSTSITSSIHRHSFENGRRFHSFKHGRYPLPNDDIEQNREDIKHVMMLEVTDGKLYYAPIGSNPLRILDVGTGTGIWAIEVADQLPGAEVLGIDLSPIQPDWVPPNCRFMVDDAEEEWMEHDYNMVHMRTMATLLKDVPKVVKYAFNALKPGGWLEMQEIHPVPTCDDGTMPDNDELVGFYKMVRLSLGRYGMDLLMAEKLRPILEEAGFQSVQCIVKKVPVGPWAKAQSLRVAGLYCRQAIDDMIPAMAGKPFREYGISAAECELIGVGVRKSLKDMSRHRYLPFYFWTAQKPA